MVWRMLEILGLCDNDALTFKLKFCGAWRSSMNESICPCFMMHVSKSWSESPSSFEIQSQIKL
jgi:hypothetical protein